MFTSLVNYFHFSQKLAITQKYDYVEISAKFLCHPICLRKRSWWKKRPLGAVFSFFLFIILSYIYIDFFSTVTGSLQESFGGNHSRMFYYTLSVINTMFVPCTALLYDSTATTRTLKLFTILLSVSSGINLISLLMISFLVYQVPPQKIVRWVEILGIQRQDRTSSKNRSDGFHKKCSFNV